MGRWAQSKRRGGGTSGAAPPPPPAAFIGATDGGAGVLSLAFDRPVTAVPGAVPDATSLIVNGVLQTVTFAGQLTDIIVQVVQGEDPSFGELVQWAAQPPWILDEVDLASSIMVT